MSATGGTLAQNAATATIFPPTDSGAINSSEQILVQGTQIGAFTQAEQANFTYAGLTKSLFTTNATIQPYDIDSVYDIDKITDQ